MSIQRCSNVCAGWVDKTNHDHSISENLRRRKMYCSFDKQSKPLAHRSIRWRYKIVPNINRVLSMLYHKYKVIFFEHHVKTHESEITSHTFIFVK